VALLTDFGTRDPYVAAVKGVIAARTRVPIHDLTHEIAPFDVFEAAWFLRAVVPYWQDTVFVCVVDPGVGTSRRIVAMRSGTNVFLAPDNGLLMFVTPSATFSVTNESLFLPSSSTTFHGRDRFAPVAAAIANGTPLEELGPPIDDLLRLDYEEPTYADDVVRGTIVAIDRFGNAITDLEREKIPFDLRTRTTYGGAGAFHIVGSTGHVEISMAGASAAEHLNLTRLERVELWPRSDGSSEL
jgi:S-adenosylmethionine hydrolase